MSELEKIYKALANKRRLTIIKFLKKQGESSVGQIAEHLRLSFKSTSGHLAILRSADILEKEQRGLVAFYSINREAHSILKHLLSII